LSKASRATILPLFTLCAAGRAQPVVLCERAKKRRRRIYVHLRGLGRRRIFKRPKPIPAGRQVYRIYDVRKSVQGHMEGRTVSWFRAGWFGCPKQRRETTRRRTPPTREPSGHPLLRPRLRCHNTNVSSAGGPTAWISRLYCFINRTPACVVRDISTKKRTPHKSRSCPSGTNFRRPYTGLHPTHAGCRCFNTPISLIVDRRRSTNDQWPRLGPKCSCGS